MRIVYLKVYQVDLPGREARHISGGRAGQHHLEIGTVTGLTAWGETCPFGPQYLPAFAEGVRGAISVVAPALIGADPTNINQITQRLNAGIRDQEQMKSGVEMVCWDLLGKHVNLPAHSLLSGMLSEKRVPAVRRRRLHYGSKRPGGWRHEPGGLMGKPYCTEPNAEAT